MTRPAYLPPLPAVPTAAPPDGFASAVRAAGRRRRRTAGTTAGGGLVALLLLASPLGPAGTAGLQPTAPSPTGALSPAPGSATPEGNAGRTPDPARGPDGAVPAPPADPGDRGGYDATPVPDGSPAYPADPATPPGGPGGPADPQPTAPPDPTPDGEPRPPWRRGEVEADQAYLARCVAGEDSGGTRHGDWCLTAGAVETTRKTATLTLQACATVPTASALTFADGRELDFVVSDGERERWSSATGRTFPASAAPVETPYGRCTEWVLRWVRFGDDGGYVGPGDYTVTVTLRAAGGHGSDRVPLRLLQ